MNKQLKLLGIAALVALVAVSGATWFVRAPYATLQSIKTAAERRDIPALNRMIDFPALKSSLKLLMMNAVGIQGEPESPGKGLMRMFAGALAGPVVDAMVTPESISAMFGGQLPSMRAGVPAKTGSPGSESESTSIRILNVQETVPGQFLAIARAFRLRPTAPISGKSCD